MIASKSIRAIAGHLALSASLPIAACQGSFGQESAIRAIADSYGVDVVYEVGPDFLPQEWQAPPLNGTATAIDHRELSRVLQLLPRWLEKYPVTILQENLVSVRLCRALEIVGVSYGGANHQGDLYLTVGTEGEGYSARFLELTFHHEFSSILMYYHEFPRDEWLAANPPEVEYVIEPNQVLDLAQQERATEGTEELYRIGLLAEYARADLVNDVNMYAEVTFGEPERMKRLVDTYTAVRAKYEVLKSFYLGLDPRFADWFARIG